MSDAQVDDFFLQRHVTPVWSLDAHALPSSQALGSLNGWPSHTTLRLFDAESVGFIDGGVVNFGLVRDSTLNATNDAEFLWESFESTIRLAGEVLNIDLDICPDGKTSLPVSIVPCSLGS